MAREFSRTDRVGQQIHKEIASILQNYLSILEDNKGYIRTLLASRMRMRAVPAIKFLRDGSLSEGIRISNLVDDTLNKDKERARNAGRSLDEEQED